MKHYLIFISGIGGSPRKTWGDFPALMTGRGSANLLCLLFYALPASRLRRPFSRKVPPIRTAVQGLRRLIRLKCPDAHCITFVAHSLGGVVARQYLVEELKADRPSAVDKLALLATPNSAADLARAEWFISWRYPKLRQLCRGTEFIDLLNDDWTQFRMEERLDLLYIAAGQDDVVDETTAKHLWGTGFFEVAINESHRSISRPANDKSVVYEAVNAFIHTKTQKAERLSRKTMNEKSVELAAILDWIVKESSSLLERSWSIPQMWEILRECSDLANIALTRYAKIGRLLPPATDKLLQAFIAHAIHNYLADLEFAIPRNESDKDGAGLKKTKALQGDMERQWKILKNIWIHDDGLTAALTKFIADGKQWPLVGFADAIAFKHHLNPDTRFLLQNGPDRYRLLMEVLLEAGLITEQQILDHGFSKATFTEVTNALARDKYLKMDYDGFVLTDLGKMALPVLLV